MEKFEKLGTHTFQSFQNFRFSDMEDIMFKDVPITVLYFPRILVINTGSEGPDFVDFLEVPEIIQKVLQYVPESRLAILE